MRYTNASGELVLIGKWGGLTLGFKPSIGLFVKIDGSGLVFGVWFGVKFLAEINWPKVLTTKWNLW